MTDTYQQKEASLNIVGLKQNSAKKSLKKSHRIMDQQKFSEALQSQIAQEQVFHSQIQSKQQSRKNSMRENQPNQNHKRQTHKQENTNPSEVQNQNQRNSYLILGNSANKKVQIISIKQIRRYQELAKIYKKIPDSSFSQEKSDKMIKLNNQKAESICCTKKILHISSAFNVPFSFENVNTTINNQQKQLQVSDLSVFSQLRDKTQDKQEKKIRKRQNMLLRQISSSKYFIQVPLDLNAAQYQLDIELNLQKNRSLQIYLINAENLNKQSQTVPQDVVHYKYEIVKLPPNFLRVRLYLLIERQNKSENSHQIKPEEKIWRVWKQLQIPLVLKLNEQPQNSQLNLSQSIKVTVINFAQNSTRIKINDLVDFNIKLSHPISPVCYYCIQQDFNGVQMKKISLSGRQYIQASEQFINDGCQGKCQII